MDRDPETYIALLGKFCCLISPSFLEIDHARLYAGKLPDRPIILFHGSEEYDWERDFPGMAEEVILLLDNQSEPAFLIADMSAGLSDVIFGTNYAARTGTQLFLHHPNMREFLAVTSSKVVVLAAQGMQSATFGMVPVSVYPTLEDALEHARIGS